MSVTDANSSLMRPRRFRPFLGGPTSVKLRFKNLRKPFLELRLTMPSTASRREILRAGLAGFGMLSLPGMLRLREASAKTVAPRSGRR